VDWGDAPTWLASILTGLSLLLGFSILRSDRQKEERRQANAIAVGRGPTTVTRVGSALDLRECRFMVWNSSEGVIVEPTLTLEPIPRKELQKLRALWGNGDPRSLPQVEFPMVEELRSVPAEEDPARLHNSIRTLGPGESTTFAVMLGEHSPLNYEPHLRFADASGERWERNGRTNRLSRIHPSPG